jgi:signal transduction histidine kinase
MRSISMKLLLAFIIVSLVGVVIFFLVARWNTNIEIQDFLSEQDQTEVVERAAEYYRENNSWDGFNESWPTPPVDNTLGHSRPGMSTPFILIDTNQQVVFGRGEKADQFNQGDFVSSEDLENALEINSDGEIIGWLLFTKIDWRKSAPEPPIFRSMDALLIYSALGSLVVALILGLLFSNRLSRPLKELSTAAQRAATGDLSHKVTVNSKDEIGALASSFNQMMEDLERLISARKQMTADIAHELRTPISVILGHADGVHEGIMEPSIKNFEIVRDEALRLERLVKDLKILSQADVGELPLVIREVGANDLVYEVERTSLASLQEKNITLKVEAESNLPTLAIDPDRILQAIRNILNNAIHHTPEGGQIFFQVRLIEDSVQLNIQDSGPGLEPSELKKIFNRFYRTDSSRTRDSEGSGLGLAISRSVIEQHGGSIWAESKEGEGLKIIIRFQAMEPS